MKILCVIDNLGSGGAQRQLVTIARGLKQQGFGAIFFVYHTQDHYLRLLQELEIPVHLRCKRHRFSWKPVLEIRKLIKQHNIKAVISFLETPNLYAELAVLGLKDVKLIISERSAYNHPNLTMTRRVKSLMHVIADTVVCNSYRHGAWLAKNASYLKNKIRVIWNGVDTELFRPGHPVRGDVPHGTRLRLLSVGRLTVEKNALGVIEAMEISVNRYGLDVSLDWVGESNIGPPAYRESVLAGIERASLGSRFRFLGAVSNMSDIYPAYDALLICSLYEGTPNVVCEALACGLPVLGSKAGDIPRLIENGKNGYLFDVQDVVQIADTIKMFFVMSAEERYKLSLDARRFAETNLTVPSMVENYQKLLVG